MTIVHNGVCYTQLMILILIIFNIQLNNKKPLKLKIQICYTGDTVLICIGNSWNEVLTNRY